ncbi:MAG TPA: FecR family protein, partial [Frankiaceae bacterium]|nr:FecR family protein [Frankiaceae bacterium]
MRPRSVVAIGLALTLAGLVAPAVAQDQDGYRHGRLRYVDPGVSLQRATDAGAEEASGNEPFLPGDRVWTDGGGRAEFQFPDGSLVRLDRRSKLDYSGHEEEREERIVLRLWSGGVMVHAGSRNAARFEIETPGGTVTALEGSVVRVDVDGSEARVSVYSGEGLLDDGRNRVRLASGERTFSRWGEAASEPERFDVYERDEFVSWDEDRESTVRAADASPYLPGELAIYSDEFARNGDWRYESSVGYVWVPQVDTGWRPYWNGHWTWTPYGWTWIPSERWGWAPFHYGRWDYASSFGWYWVPGRTWGPAWVSWAVGGGYVGWCPLGRHDRPVVAWGGYRGGRVDGLDRGRAVSRGRSGSGLLDAWSVVRNNELGRRDVAQRRVAVDRIDPASVRVADSAVLRPTRDGLTLRQGDAVPRAVSTRQTPGDFVRELGVDNKTTIPAPWTRGYGPPPAGAEGARYGAPRPTDGDQREAVGRVPAGRTGEAATSAPASQATGSATPRGGRPVPWYRPADEGQRSSGS